MTVQRKPKLIIKKTTNRVVKKVQRKPKSIIKKTTNRVVKKVQRKPKPIIKKTTNRVVKKVQKKPKNKFGASLPVLRSNIIGQVPGMYKEPDEKQEYIDNANNLLKKHQGDILKNYQDMYTGITNTVTKTMSLQYPEAYTRLQLLDKTITGIISNIESIYSLNEDNADITNIASNLGAIYTDLNNLVIDKLKSMHTFVLEDAMRKSDEENIENKRIHNAMIEQLRKNKAGYELQKYTKLSNKDRAKMIKNSPLALR
jgi:hypothetical protein